MLKVENLRTYFDTYLGTLKAVDGVSFEIGEKEILGLVGESGCGKTVTALSIMRLIKYPGKIVSGRIFFKNEDLLKKMRQRCKRLEGKGFQ